MVECVSGCTSWLTLSPGHFMIGQGLLPAPTLIRDLETKIQGLKHWNILKQDSRSLALEYSEARFKVLSTGIF